MTSPANAASRRALAVVYVIAVGVAFALAYGAFFGASNQQTYLLDGLVRTDPELYRHDWFVIENHHYHVAFAVLTELLFMLDHDGAVALGIAQIVVMVATFAAIFGLTAAVTSRSRLLVFVGVVGLIALGGGRALGGSYLYAGYVQPSSLATLAWLIAINAWIRDRTLLAGIALAAGAVFHLNYAVLGIGVFALTELVVTRRFQLRRMAMLLGPSLIVVIAFLPTMIASSRTSEDELALEVLVQFVFPGHFKPKLVALEMLSLAGWLLIALSLRPAAHTDAQARLFWFATVVMSSCIVAVVVVSFPPLLPLTRLFVWRIAPFGVLVAQLVLLASLYEIARGDRPRPNGWHLVGLIVGASAIVVNAFTRPHQIYPQVATGVMVACAVVIAVRREHLASVLCAALCAFALWRGRTKLVSPTLFDSYEGPVMRWARASSPRDAVFLVPPYYGSFRLLARRAVVVDAKSPPMYLDELVAWYRRLCEAVGGGALPSMPAVFARWDGLPAERLIEIARTFQATFIVLEKHRSRARLAMPAVFEDDVNVVYAIPAR